MPEPGLPRRVTVPLGVIALVALVALLARRPSSPPPRPARPAESAADPERISDEEPTGAHPAPRPREAPKAIPPGAEAIDPVKREQMRALIWQAIGHPAPPAPSPKRGAAYVLPEHPPWEDDPQPVGGNGKIDPKYIQARVREDFFPLARQCYADGVEQNPALAGSVVFAFNIVGDDETGGIVEAVDVLEKSTLRDPEVIDCMRQSFLGISFPPPEGGGEVTVVYPIVFDPGDGG